MPITWAKAPKSVSYRSASHFSRPAISASNRHNPPEREFKTTILIGRWCRTIMEKYRPNEEVSARLHNTTMLLSGQANAESTAWASVFPSDTIISRLSFFRELWILQSVTIFRSTIMTELCSTLRSTHRAI